mgnify:CR=1 FL=1
MYRILLDEKTLYYPGDSECVVYDAVVKLKAGEAGSCEFSVPPINPLYDSIRNRKSTVKVYRDNRMVFCGEVRESDKDRHKNKKVYAVGELAYLMDTIQPQHYYGDATPTAFLAAVLANHNNQIDADDTEARKKFECGNITVSTTYDNTAKIVDHETTLDAIRTQLVERVGGCLRIRYANGHRYLDIVPLTSYGDTNTQGINFGENLLDYSENMTASDIVTCVIPLGARIDSDDDFEKRVDITTVNNNKNYITADSTIIGNFGHVWKVVVFDDIDTPTTLIAAGRQWLSENQYETMTLKVSAVDLSAMDSDMMAMNLGDNIPIYAEPYGLSTSMPIQEQTLNLMAPQKDTIVLSATMKNKKVSISGQVGKSGDSIRNATHATEMKIRNVIRQEMANIMAKFAGTRGGYKVVEFDSQTGLWTRDLYMDAQNIAQATHIMEISLNGIRFYNGAAGQYTDPTKWKTAWSLDGEFCADFITAGTMQAERILGGILKIGLVHQAQSAQDSDEYSGIECYALVPLYGGGTGVRKIGEWDKDGLSILYTDSNSGWDTTTGITNGEIRGYFGTGASATRAGTLNLVRRNADNQVVTGDVSLKAEVNNLLLVGNHDALVRGGNSVKIQLGADSVVSWDGNGAHGGTIDVGPTGAFHATVSGGGDCTVHYKNGIIYQVDYN